jgi:histidyl-tRNA synthetase
MIMHDKAGRELALRPEMTPSVTRMVSRIYEGTPKPLRLFSIANFVRNEKPQRGRNREFWQLNFDVFGTTNLNADIEILQIALEIMLSFSSMIDSKEKPLTLYLNDRRIIHEHLKVKANIDEGEDYEVVRILDKSTKLSKEDLTDKTKNQYH